MGETLPVRVVPVVLWLIWLVLHDSSLLLSNIYPAGYRNDDDASACMWWDPPPMDQPVPLYILSYFRGRLRTGTVRYPGPGLPAGGTVVLLYRYTYDFVILTVITIYGRSGFSFGTLQQQYHYRPVVTADGFFRIIMMMAAGNSKISKN